MRIFISLACSIGSMGIAWGSLLSLNISDRISLQRGVFLSSLGFVYFVSLTDFFNRFLLETTKGLQWRKKYHLMVSDVMDITNKLVSAVQASLSCLAGFLVCKSSCNRSFLHASHFASEAYAWFGAAYFFYDLWSMYKVHIHKVLDKLKMVKDQASVSVKNGNGHQMFEGRRNGGNGVCDGEKEGYRKKEIRDDYGNEITLEERPSFWRYISRQPLMVGHHIFIGSFGLCVIAYLRGGLGDCIFSFIFLMEASTPFVSLRSILSTMGLKLSNLYLINGVLMLVTFFVFRILMLPFVFYWYSQTVNLPFIRAIASLPRGCKISICILFLPQIYWFYLILRGALKVFFPKKSPSVTTKRQPNSTKPTINVISDDEDADQGVKRRSERHMSLDNGKSTQSLTLM
ncbi:ceramide synthase [Phlebotomus argentipes]|uniref:ceramide synthase n=1 Tax=Phlebotomus argentipes TaxID=94469 RepID=UPI002892C0C9|nr:ceramide synthase [Phlebotomus argentipes]